MITYELPLALRRLWRRRTQTTLTLATFTVAISLSLLSWSLFHTMFLRNPEFDPKGELIVVNVTGEIVNGRIVPLPREDFDAWRSAQTVFKDFALAGLYRSTFVETDNGRERLLGAVASADSLRMVGATPLMGRLFTPEDDRIGAASVVMISERTWQNRFNHDPHIIGRLVTVDGRPATVVGVMPASFRFPNDQEIWQAAGFNGQERNARDPVFDLVARLKPGQTIERATKDLQQITARQPNSQLNQYKLTPVVRPFRENFLLPDMHHSALILFVLALIFVVVGCTNAANLVMIDFLGRASDIASSLAVGVPRAAAIRTMLYQLCALAFVAAGIAYAALLVFAPYVHASMARVITPYWLLFNPAWHQVGMTVLLALVSVAFAAIAPIAYLLVLDPERIIQNNAGANRSSGHGLWRRVLLIGQVALLTLLAVSCGLLVRSSRNVNEEHWGYDGRAIFASKIAMPNAQSMKTEDWISLSDRFIAELERIPGVTAAAFVSAPAGFSAEPSVWYARTLDGLADGRSEGGALWSRVTPDVFKVFDVPFIEGETFRPEPAPPAPTTGSSNQAATSGTSASASPPPVPPMKVIINQGLALRLWPGQQALGRALYVRFQDPKQTPLQVVIIGVVRDYQAAGPKVANNDFIFVNPRPVLGPFLYVRGQFKAPSLADVRAATQRADPRLAIYLPTTLQGVVDIELSAVHLTTRLTLVYALSAVILCAVGVYSLTVSQILQRQREFGIRLALGIAPGPLWARFARGHVASAAVGVAIGLGAAFGAMRILQSMLFGVNARDPLTFTLVATVILLIAFLACIPSLFRLQRINPSECLRSL